ncbi:alpha-D-ribose 1-methylphosphonate 5-triphosphate diphosphatase [Halonotius roseus]|uniref:Alpha-D-ribose 1-methylphosphonate 5-triphosphate diphosphatase n=1 Tax=Halonotius roseus TaxID=2511997 RepID=A0A544QMS4_9EURY|nr:alpha-D-ribose 1-methylphosphonate 5-triphosphate diphosphatase [Halonotius roseus]TQQ80226.1 alpha-D-ribose 1-methylphosphonate 5-triphosphate diphosphatase [Halonotius roseus]
MSKITEIRNARVVTPTRCLDDGRVILTGDRIAQVGATPDTTLSRARTIDADGRLVMPGLIDLHGDDIEHHHSPRAGAAVQPRTALTTADRTNLLNGVTTKFHAVAFEEAPDDGRSLATASALATEISQATYTLGDNRLHARCELSDESVTAVTEAVGSVGVDLLSVMHHAPGDGQYDDDSFERHYIEDRNWSADGVARLARQRASADPTSRDDRVERIVDLAARAGVPVASHDDASPAAVDRMADHGVTISEYPLTLDAIRRADARGLTTVMGAPNLLRGGSLWDNLAADTAIDAGCVDVLCADYHPPSLLAAPFVDTGESLSTRVNRVTRNPADAVGLTDRGRIEAGARADLLVVDPDPTPTVERVFVGGESVARLQPTGSPQAEPTEAEQEQTPSLSSYPSPSAFHRQR